MRSNYSSIHPAKSSGSNNKSLLVRRTSKNSVAPFRSSRDSKRGSMSPANSGSSSPSHSPQVTQSETLLSNFSDTDNQKSTGSLSISKRDLLTKKEFNSMLEFDELNLPEIESSRTRSVTLSTNGDDNFQDSTMSQISQISELSKSQLQAARNRTRRSNIGNSLYELSLHLRTINDVKSQILYFKSRAPLKYYRYCCVSDLLLASLSCPPDMPFYILTIAAKMVQLGNVAPSYDLKYYIRVTELLISNPEIFFVTFHADQDKPQKKLRKMLSIFQGKLANLDDSDYSDDDDHKLTTRQVEEFIKLNCEFVHLECPFSIDPNKRTQNYHPDIEIDERVTFRYETFPDNYTKEEQKTVCFIKELNQSYQPDVGSPLMRFLSSSDNLLQRRKRGSETYKRLTQREIAQILKLCSLFTSWEVAYDASLAVWDVMKHSEKFEIEALLSQLPVSFGDFLVEAVKSFAQMAGIKIERIQNTH